VSCSEPGPAPAGRAERPLAAAVGAVVRNRTGRARVRLDRGRAREREPSASRRALRIRVTRIVRAHVATDLAAVRIDACEGIARRARTGALARRPAEPRRVGEALLAYAGARGDERFAVVHAGRRRSLPRARRGRRRSTRRAARGFDVDAARLRFRRARAEKKRGNRESAYRLHASPIVARPSPTARICGRSLMIVCATERGTL
jgi:hypothetical protein